MGNCRNRKRECECRERKRDDESVKQTKPEVWQRFDDACVNIEACQYLGQIESQREKIESGKYKESSTANRKAGDVTAFARRGKRKGKLLTTLKNVSASVKGAGNERVKSAEYKNPSRVCEERDEPDSG